MRDYGPRYAAQRNIGTPAPMRPSADPALAIIGVKGERGNGGLEGKFLLLGV